MGKRIDAALQQVRDARKKISKQKNVEAEQPVILLVEPQPITLNSSRGVLRIGPKSAVTSQKIL
jgi:hypothetical protein